MANLDPRVVRPIARSVTEQVTAELRRLILSGALAPGENLSLRKVADILNVSFIPVRDALNVLESEGLVVNPPGRGATVAPLDLNEFHAIYRVSRILESELARRSCPLLTDETLDRLYSAAEEFGGRDRTTEEIWADHREFHTALLAPAASAWELRILNMHWRASERYSRIGFGLLDPHPEEHDRRRDAHQFLIDAFRKRDPAFAGRALDSHLAESEKLASTALVAFVSPLAAENARSRKSDRRVTTRENANATLVQSLATR